MSNQRTSPEGAPVRPAVVLLLGAEGCSEAEGVDWLRDPTPDETADFWHDNPVVSNIDHNGRPYFLVAVEPSAPTRK